MFKKSIPLMLGALLLGTNVEAIDITCPQSIEPSKLSSGGFTFYLNYTEGETVPVVTFADYSEVTVEKDRSVIMCRYTGEGLKSNYLTTWTPQKCRPAPSPNVEKGGKAAVVKEGTANLNCSDSASCANFKCEPF